MFARNASCVFESYDIRQVPEPGNYHLPFRSMCQQSASPWKLAIVMRCSVQRILPNYKRAHIEDSQCYSEADLLMI